MATSNAQRFGATRQPQGQGPAAPPCALHRARGGACWSVLRSYMCSGGGVSLRLPLYSCTSRKTRLFIAATASRVADASTVATRRHTTAPCSVLAPTESVTQSGDRYGCAGSSSRHVRLREIFRVKVTATYTLQDSHVRAIGWTLELDGSRSGRPVPGARTVTPTIMCDCRGHASGARASAGKSYQFRVHASSSRWTLDGRDATRRTGCSVQAPGRETRFVRLLPKRNGHYALG